MVVESPPEALTAVNDNANDAGLEAVFGAQYERIAQVIARIIHDPARAEELAVEVFLKWPRRPDGKCDATAWLYRVAVRLGLDELRRRARRARYERMFRLGPQPTPEEIRAVSEEQERVRTVLAAIKKLQAEILLLRAEGLGYAELSTALEVNPSSIGTLVARAQQAFRKEYIRRYGKS
jgi:RNA polymerase sigma-70 factor (ECF subfamily)